MSMNANNANWYLKKSDQLGLRISQWNAKTVKVLKQKENYRIFSAKAPIL